MTSERARRDRGRRRDADAVPGGRAQPAARDALRGHARRARSGPGRKSRCRTSPGAAGVSRQTLYKEFGSRDEFAQAFVIHVGERFLDDGRRRRPRASRRPARRDRRRSRDVPAHRRGGPAWSGSCSATTAPAECCPSSPRRGCRSSSSRPRGSSRRSARAGPRRRPRRRSSSPSRWSGWRSATSRLRATEPEQTAAQAGELLGPFIDRALGVAG